MRDAYVIRTPENVTFELELAGVASRALAWALDIMVVIGVITVLSCVIGTFASVVPGLAAAFIAIAVFVMQWWYSAICEWWLGGQTFGKRIVGLRTMGDRGFRITFLQAVVRNLVRVIDILPALYFVGGCSALLDKQGRRLGDLAAATIVVKERRAPKPAHVVPPSQRYNTFIDDPLVAHAARRVGPPERDAMIALALRREELPVAVRHELFSKLADHLETRLGVPRPPFFSPEKYVLNLTAVVLAAPVSPPRGSR